MILQGSYFAVDTFFFMSGVLVAWKLYPCLLKKRPTLLSSCSSICEISLLL